MSIGLIEQRLPIILKKGVIPELNGLRFMQIDSVSHVFKRRKLPENLERFVSFRENGIRHTSCYVTGTRHWMGPKVYLWHLFPFHF